jgi:hypothetical protein
MEPKMEKTGSFSIQPFNIIEVDPMKMAKRQLRGLIENYPNILGINSWRKTKHTSIKIMIAIGLFFLLTVSIIPRERISAAGLRVWKS